MTSLIMIDDDDNDDDAKRHWKSDDAWMTVWLLPLMMLPLAHMFLNLKKKMQTLK